MISIDIRTIIVICIITNLVSCMVMYFLWLQNHHRFKGTLFWIFDFILQTLAFTFIALRNYIPDWISINVANSLSILGIILGYIGLQHFLNKKSNQLFNYILLIVFTFIHYWFTYKNPNLSVRNLNLSGTGLIIFSQCIWLLIVKSDKETRKITLGVGLVFSAFCLVNLVRIFKIALNDNQGNDFMNSGLFEAIVMLSYQMLLVLLTYSLVLMFNKKLIAEILEQEETFYKSFHNSPHAILLTKFHKGEIIKFNSNFLLLTGYNENDVKGKTLSDLNFWDKESDKFEAEEELIKNNKVTQKEYLFRKKNGERITGQYSAGLITLKNEKSVILNITDISVQKEAEKIINDSGFFAQATIDALPEHLCVLNKDGVIISVNKAWKNFADQNPPVPLNYCIGDNYLEICDNAQGMFSDEAKPMADGIRNVLNFKNEFYSLEYPCNSPGGEERWFIATITRFELHSMLMVLIAHINITIRKKAEIDLLNKMNELEQFNDLAVDRELKMIELKKEVNELLLKLGQTEKYQIIK